MDLHGLMKNKNLIFISLISASLFSCTQEADHKKPQEKQSIPVKISTPEFNADSAYQYVKDQVDFGPRVPGSEGHSKCAVYFERKLSSFGWSVHVQKAEITAHDGKRLPMKNIIASYQS
jgi:glutaminyl-peptide cyclotransferase